METVPYGDGRVENTTAPQRTGRHNTGRNAGSALVGAKPTEPQVSTDADPAACYELTDRFKDYAPLSSIIYKRAAGVIGCPLVRGSTLAARNRNSSHARPWQLGACCWPGVGAVRSWCGAGCRGKDPRTSSTDCPFPPKAIATSRTWS